MGGHGFNAAEFERQSRVYDSLTQGAGWDIGRQASRSLYTAQYAQRLFICVCDSELKRCCWQARNTAVFQVNEGDWPAVQ